jgi:SpoVK/Ycf46/Vps4 family AAA+-type ATPase
MKGFIRHLDTYKKQQPTQFEYISLIENINQNYYEYKIGPIVTNTNSYSSWQQKHEIILSSPKKTIKYIDVNVESIKDLIDLIDQNPFDPTCDYNIDLKALHSIRTDLQSLQDMIGLRDLKQSVLDQLLYFIQELHKGSDGDYKHTVLTGPPGTGKTEVAKILGSIYSKIGTLQTTGFKKVTRADLVAGYLGQTAIKTQKVIEASLGGVLFLDEAYSLGDPNQTDMFSKECVDTLCEALSDHKNDLMFIIAGYEESLHDCFFSLNPGLDSRFLWRFSIESYSSIELYQIFIKKVRESKWDFENINEIKSTWFEKNIKHFKRFGRDIENLFTYTKIVHGRRIYGKPESQKKHINKEDLEKGFDVFLKHKQDKKRPSVIHDMYL